MGWWKSLVAGFRSWLGIEEPPRASRADKPVIRVGPPGSPAISGPVSFKPVKRRKVQEPGNKVQKSASKVREPLSGVPPAADPALTLLLLSQAAGTRDLSDACVGGVDSQPPAPDAVFTDGPATGSDTGSFDSGGCDCGGGGGCD